MQCVSLWMSGDVPHNDRSHWSDLSETYLSFAKGSFLFILIFSLVSDSVEIVFILSYLILFKNICNLI